MLEKYLLLGFIIIGVSAVAYALGNFVEILMEEELRNVIGGRRMEKKIKNLSNHYIICGYGRMGKQIAIEFKEKDVPFVVIENDEVTVRKLEVEGMPFIEGNATEDRSLKTAGIDRAKGLISVTTSDADNIFITLTARGLNPNLTIVARAATEEAEEKLKRAGANKVFSPYVIGARRMAAGLLRPTVVDFLDTLMHNPQMDLEIDEVKVAEESKLNNVTLQESQIRQKTGAIILGIKKKDGKLITNPNPFTKINRGDTLIAISTAGQMEKLIKLARD